MCRKNSPCLGKKIFSAEFLIGFICATWIFWQGHVIFLFCSTLFFSTLSYFTISPTSSFMNSLIWKWLNAKIRNNYSPPPPQVFPLLDYWAWFCLEQMAPEYQKIVQWPQFRHLKCKCYCRSFGNFGFSYAGKHALINFIDIRISEFNLVSLVSIWTVRVEWISLVRNGSIWIRILPWYEFSPYQVLWNSKDMYQ